MTDSYPIRSIQGLKQDSDYFHRDFDPYHDGVVENKRRDRNVTQRIYTIISYLSRMYGMVGAGYKSSYRIRDWAPPTGLFEGISHWSLAI